jgi:heme-degrading monooxygenase HmoA
MIVTIFRFRVRPEAEDEYARWAARVRELAAQTPGCLSCTDFVAADGERVTIANFASERAQSAWSEHRDRAEAMARAVASFCVEYRLQVCSVQLRSAFPRSVQLAAFG